MTSPLDQVSVQAACLVCKCEKQGCEVDLTGAPSPFKLIDMDHKHSPAPAHGTRCDFLFIGACSDGATFDLYVAPLELKSSGFAPGKVSKQLAGGARDANSVVPRARCRFTPIVVHDGAHRKQINDLAKHPVHFRGRRYAIRVVRCGESIAEAL